MIGGKIRVNSVSFGVGELIEHFRDGRSRQPATIRTYLLRSLIGFGIARYN
jgi:hypothetical protein